VSDLRARLEAWVAATSAPGRLKYHRSKSAVRAADAIFMPSARHRRRATATPTSLTCSTPPRNRGRHRRLHRRHHQIDRSGRHRRRGRALIREAAAPRPSRWCPINSCARRRHPGFQHTDASWSAQTWSARARDDRALSSALSQRSPIMFTTGRTAALIKYAANRLPRHQDKLATRCRSGGKNEAR